MKYLIFTTQFHLVGGYERLAIELAIELNKLGVRADVLSQYTNSIPGVTEAELKLRDAGVPQVSYLGLCVNPNVFAIFRSVYRFRKLVRTEAYTAVEVSGFTPALVAAVALIGMNVKVLIGVHGIFTNKRSGGLKYFLWKQLLRVPRHVSFFAVSKAAANAWVDYLRVNAQRVPVVLNSINPAYYYAKKPHDNSRVSFLEIIGAASCDKIVLFVGRLLKSKGIDTIYNALKADLVSRKLHLVFVGRADDCETPDDAKFLADMQGDLQVAPWRDRVHFLGLRTDVPEIMGASDILVHPACREGFGLVLAEALAVGLPVVASDVDGIPEVLADTDSIMVRPGDPDELASAVFSVLEWPKEKLDAAIAKGKHRAESFRSEKRARAILELFNT
jgi:glycosyltransferase involved in cell wall biosynthesis